MAGDNTDRLSITVDFHVASPKNKTPILEQGFVDPSTKLATAHDFYGGLTVDGTELIAVRIAYIR
ncbi:hypothetical protein [Rahnella sp. R3(2024)]|uniref:hypothetical protein n=1 Tax=Rahnella sp. R3(2024) TaxID=3163550 RepID=UPI0036F06B52